MVFILLFIIMLEIDFCTRLAAMTGHGLQQIFRAHCDSDGAQVAGQARFPTQVSQAMSQPMMPLPTRQRHR
jgi:hypothetical protein